MYIDILQVVAKSTVRKLVKLVFRILYLRFWCLHTETSRITDDLICKISLKRYCNVSVVLHELCQSEQTHSYHFLMCCVYLSQLSEWADLCDCPKYGWGTALVQKSLSVHHHHMLMYCTDQNQGCAIGEKLLLKIGFMPITYWHDIR